MESVIAMTHGRREAWSRAPTRSLFSRIERPPRQPMLAVARLPVPIEGWARIGLCRRQLGEFAMGMKLQDYDSPCEIPDVLAFVERVGVEDEAPATFAQHSHGWVSCPDVFVRDAVPALLVIPQKLRPRRHVRRPMLRCHVVEEDENLHSPSTWIVMPACGQVIFRADVLGQVK